MRKDLRPSLACERLETRDTPSAGSLDTAFGSAGKLLDTHLDGPAKAVVVQADGKIVAAGTTKDAAGKGVAAVARYNADGTPDTAFDSDGVQTVSFGSRPGTFTAVTVQGDGKIVLAGDDGKLARVVRLNADGSLDTTFDADGMNQAALSSAAGTFAASDAALTADGKLVVAGTFTATGGAARAALARFNADGTRDATFGGGGVALTAAASGGLSVGAMALQADGKIVVAGAQSYGSQVFFALQRYTASGALDATFDKDGRVTTSLGQNASAVAMQILSNGRILVAGNGYQVVRYNANGSRDTSFGTQGVARLSPGGTSRAAALAVQSDGKIVVAGTTNQGANPNNAALIRYHASGQTDLSFGDRGKLVTDLGGADTVEAVAVLDGDRLLAAGASSSADDGSHLTLAKFNTGYAKTATATTLTASSATGTYGQAVTFTAKVTVEGNKTPSGNVIFKVGDTVLSTVKVNASGQATLKTIGLQAGAQKVTATYVGNSVQAASTSPVTTVTVARAQVNVVSATVPATAVYGQAVTVGARVSVKNSPHARVTGSVMFMEGNRILGTAPITTAGLAQLVLTNFTPGRHSIRAIYGGNANTIPTASPTLSVLTVTKAATSTVLGVVGNLTVSGQPLSLAVQVRAPRSTLSPAGRVVFRDGATVIGAAQLDATGKATLALPKGLAKGGHALTATYEGNGGYIASTSPAATISLTV